MSLSTWSAATTPFNSVTSLIRHDGLKELDIPYHVLETIHYAHLEVDASGVVSLPSNSPAHPRRWPLSRRLYDTALICLVEFFTTVISNSGSSVVDAATPVLGVSRLSTICCFTTVYLLGQGFGGLILPPITESFGSKYVYVGSTLGYALMCLIIGLAPSLASVIVCRLVSGILSAMPTVVAVGSIENNWNASERVWMIYMWSFFGTMALSIGPVYATFITESSLGWLWVFNIAAIVLGVLAILCCFMKESRPALVLQAHVRALKQSTHFTGLTPANQMSRPTVSEFAKTTLLLPLRLFFTEQLVFLISLMGATVISIPYLFTEALTVVYHDSDHLTTQQTSLVFLALAAGLVPTLLTRLWDQHLATSRHRAHRPLKPEDKLTGFLLAAPLLAAGLWWFGATVPPLVHISPWISIASLLLVGFASLEFDYVLSGYLTDVYGSHAASANAAMCFLRAVVGGAYPLVGQQLFTTWLGGANNATFVLAGVATGYCGVAVWFQVGGMRIREASKFAKEMVEKDRASL
ncbi:hypothetical protein LTR02_016055 [Friedmanniomyces endolithicus]|nr:hypothetical protein LTR94_018613 [Friedmanniomyces endolithicus]KAK0776734.1 hypothetical protein LTR38_015390 [Friedmanniomyces endolithicus]KAK0779102.1 hypothetical protein LTR75_015441 [Friedmanniomyces endolithicus]KAK0784863.1 hypothetical protein LTR59_011274 [Friedmanniomyces endolithicus]KAK0843037.1 hypothetical protein LTS02_016249 [Friedmanniomyces endolithicus]